MRPTRIRMANILKRLKKYLRLCLTIRQPLIHFRKDLDGFSLPADAFEAVERNGCKVYIERGDRLSESYHSFFALSLHAFAFKHISSQTVCGFIVKGDVPIACTLLNVDGLGFLGYPFERMIPFDRGHGYGWALFVKEEFRNRGFGAALHFLQFQTAKQQGLRFCNRFIEKDNSVPVRIAEKLGYKKIRELVLMRFFGSDALLILATRPEQQVYALARMAGKKIYISGAARKRAVIAA